MRLDRHIYEWGEVVLGSSTAALLFAFMRRLPVLFASSNEPFRFNEISEDYDLSFMGLEPFQAYDERFVWQRLMLLLGLAGLVPLSDLAGSIRVEENNLRIVTKNQRLIKGTFTKLHIFDDEGIAGLPDISGEIKEKNRVVDWVNVRRCSVHDVKTLKGEGDFASQIFFYPTDRSDNKTFKDLVAISHLTDAQLGDFEYSDTMVKFVVEEMMKKAGIKGSKNGIDKKRGGKQKYLSIILEPAEREVHPQIRRYYEIDPRFEFHYEELHELLTSTKKPTGYLGKITDAL